MQARELRPGVLIRHPETAELVRVDAIVEAPAMNGRTLWYEARGRGEHIAARNSDELEVVPE